MKTEGAFRRQLLRAPAVKDRDQALIALCRGRRVLHVGCVDAPFQTERIANGSILHGKLMGITSGLLGIDIDADGLDELRQQLGGDYCQADVQATEVPEEITDFDPDVILATDLIEHLDDAGAFLRGMARLGGPNTQIILTTPNALALRSTINTLAGCEVIHPHHRTLYSPQSLTVALRSSGLEPERWAYYRTQTGRGPIHRLYDALCNLGTVVRPGFSDGLLVVASSARGQ